jgi:hypothetical protein
MKIAILLGGSITQKRLEILEKVARSMQFKILDLEMLHSNGQLNEQVCSKLDFVVTDETCPLKVAKRLGVRAIDITKLRKPEFLSDLKIKQNPPKLLTPV